MKLNYKTYGTTGKPLIIAHGLFGTLDNWQSIAKKLSATFQVFAVDLRNHGRSPHADSMSFKEMAADINTFLIDQNISKAHLLGHSLGGKVMMQFANDYREKVDKLVVVDIAPKQYFGGHQEILEVLQNLPINEINSRKEATAFVQQTITDPGVVMFLLKNLTRKPDNAGFKWKMNLSVIVKDYQDMMLGITIESPIFADTLFIRGNLSRYVKDKDIPKIKEQFPHATVYTVENAGHWVHAEKPVILLEAVNTFLEEH